MRERARPGQPPNYSWPRKNSQQIRRRKPLLSQIPHRCFGKMRHMVAHFSGDLHLALDRPIDGVEKVVAPATFETAFRRGLAQTFPPPPPRFSLCSSSLAPSGSSRQAQSSPIAAPSKSASETFSVLEGHSPGASRISTFDASNHAPPDDAAISSATGST